MTVTRQSLLERFQLFNDVELLAQFHSGELTDLAKSVAGEELHRRNVDISEKTVAPRIKHQESLSADNLVPIARYFTAAEADMLKSRLEAEGVPAVVADAQTVQAVPLIAIAVGGVRVLVPESYADRALEIVRGVEKGDYALRTEPDATHIAQNMKSQSFGRVSDGKDLGWHLCFLCGRLRKRRGDINCGL